LSILFGTILGEAASFVTFTYWILAFVATKTFQDMISIFRESGCYWVFAAICFAGATFTYFVIPETKNKSPEEIQRYFGASEVPQPNCDSSSEALSSNKLSSSTVSVKIDDNRNVTKKGLLLLPDELEGDV
jgi:hypothetical protein